MIVGKRALPAISLTNESALLRRQSFARRLSLLARPQDIAMGFSGGGQGRNILAAMEVAREMGLLTLGLSGGDGGWLAQAGLDFYFSVESDDPLTVQETHETLYHVLWELVHIYFEHEGLLS